MLERGLHQGTGLLQNRPWARTRVAAVATAPDAASLDTLWRLCALLQSEGTSVVVLDASEANPGLEQLLTSTSLCTLPSAPTRLDDGAPGSLAVLPAARGLQQLSTQAQPGTLCSLYQTCDTTGTPLARLLPMLRAYDLVLLHAPMSCLGPLLQPHGIRPLLLAQPGAEGTQEAYRQLKHLALYTGLSAQLCVVVAQPGDGAERAARTQLATLQRCAQSAASFSATSGLPLASAWAMSPSLAPDRHSRSLAVSALSHSRRNSARLRYLFSMKARVSSSHNWP